METTQAIDKSVPPKVKPLIVSLDQNDSKLTSEIISKNDTLKNMSRVQRVKYGDKRGKDDYSYVILAFINADIKGQDDPSKVVDFYKYYSTAPVSVWVLKQGMEESLKPIMQEHQKVFIFNPGQEASVLIQAHKYCKAIHDAKYKDDVTKAFNNFDADGSGEIDKEELGELTKMLGCELNEEQLSAALLDLDLDQNGTIDIYEFSRWYFTGMKSYNGSTRTMLKIGKKTANIFNAMAEKTKAAMADDLKTRAHSLKISLNDPGQDVGTEAGFAFHLCGSHYNEFKVRMNQYEGTFDFENFKEMDENFRENPKDYKQFKFEIVIGRFRDPESWCDKLEERLQEAFQSAEIGNIFSPKFHHRDGKVICGFQAPLQINDIIRNERVANLKVPYDIQQLIAGIDQHVSFKTSYKTSFKDILDSQKSLPELLLGGFKTEIEVQLVANVKAAIMENLQSEESQGIAGILMMMSPAFLLQFAGTLDIEFDDLEGLKQSSPVPLDFTFENVFQMVTEKILGEPTDPSTMFDNHSSKDNIFHNKEVFEKLQYDYQREMFKAGKYLHGIIDMMKDGIEEGNVFELNIMWPDMGVIHFNIKSDGLINFMKHAGIIGYQVVLKQFQLMTEESGDEDSYTLVEESVVVVEEGEDYL